ncbi:MAG: hypothetical protein ABIH11_03280 [Candidatus Altiarchaeota archaeon]
METVLDGIVDDKIIRIMNALMKDKTELYHLNKLSKKSRVPIATTSRIVKVLVKQEIAETLKIGGIKLYRLKKNGKTSTLSKLLGVACK